MPNFVAFNTVLCGLCRHGQRMSEAEELMKTMFCKGHPPDATTYTAMIMGYCKKGDAEKALHIFDEMSQKGFSLGLENGSAVIGWLCKESKASKAKIVLDGMCKMGNAPDTAIYTRAACPL